MDMVEEEILEPEEGIEEMAEENEAAAQEEGLGEVSGSLDTEEAEAEEESPAKWYVVHTYSGYENKVKANIEKTIENRALQDQIFEIRIPIVDTYELKNGARKNVQKKLFPGYVLVHMIMNDDTWYVVRNTRGVTGFVGPGSKPVPLSDAEIKPLGIKSGKVDVDFGEGDLISVVAGVWKDTQGVVQKLDFSKQTATINVELFGRETPVEISFAEVRKAG